MKNIIFIVFILISGCCCKRDFHCETLYYFTNAVFYNPSDNEPLIIEIHTKNNIHRFVIEPDDFFYLSSIRSVEDTIFSSNSISIYTLEEKLLAHWYISRSFYQPLVELSSDNINASNIINNDGSLYKANINLNNKPIKRNMKCYYDLCIGY